MISRTLRLWIAQSESWHTFVDFQLPIENQADYPFLKQPDDFYISVFGKMFDVVSEEEPSEDRQNQLLAVAKGLEIYSLRETAKEFHGVNQAKNMLYVAALYYLADYTASAYILARLFSTSDYGETIDRFLSSFLRRDLDESNPLTVLLTHFLQTGDPSHLRDLQHAIHSNLSVIENTDPGAFISYKIAEVLLGNFAENNIWKDIQGNTDASIPVEQWNRFIQKGLQKEPSVWSFFPSQRRALQCGILSADTRCFSMQMPTSAGKTAICELIILNHILRHGGKVLFLAPFRALASELKSGFSRRLSDLGISSKTIYGGNMPTQEERDAIQDVQVLIATPEKFMAMESVLPDVYNIFSLVICDEGHLLDDSNRGLSYELLLAKFKAQSMEASMRFVFLSAIIPNIEEINEWLDGSSDSVVRSDYRPTELDFAYLHETSKRNFMLDVNPSKPRPYNYQLNNFLTKRDFTYINPLTRRTNTYSTDSGKSRSVASALQATVSGAVALFSPQKKGHRGVEGLAEEVIEQLGTLLLPKPIDLADSSKVEHLREYFSRIFGDDYLLTKLVSYGVLFHHGDLPQDVREVIEDTVRLSQIRLILCTNTLAEGVNLPIKTVVVHSTQRYNSKNKAWESLKIRDLKNLFGRAGRAGKETKGLVIVVDPKDRAIVAKVMQNEGNEPANGHLFSLIRYIDQFVRERRLVIDNRLLEKQNESFLRILDSIDTSIINLLSEEVDVPDLQHHIESLMKNTFAYHQGNEDQRETLHNIFVQRGNRLEVYVANGQFKVMKSSGSDLRFYEMVKDILDLEDEVWTSTDSPTNQAWNDHLFTVLFSLPQMLAWIDEFNDAHANRGFAIDHDVLKKIVILWMEGKWYKEIAREIHADVDGLLTVFSSIIGSRIQLFASRTIRITNLLLEESGIEISPVVRDWSLYVSYGLQQKRELDLTEVGFTDRDAVITLCKWLNENDVDYFTLEELRRELRQLKERILQDLKNQLTFISYEKLKNQLEMLNHRYVF